jgi:hypothetical protein
MKDGFMLAILENYGHPLKNKNATQTEQRHAYARILAEREIHLYNRALSSQKRAEMSLKRLSGLVDHAYRASEVYRELYQKAGFSPGSIRTYSDFCSLPWIDKELLIRISAEMAEREDIDRNHRSGIWLRESANRTVQVPARWGRNRRRAVQYAQ